MNKLKELNIFGMISAICFDTCAANTGWAKGEVDEWAVASGQCQMGSSKWAVASGQWRVGSGQWRVAVGCGQK